MPWPRSPATRWPRAIQAETGGDRRGDFVDPSGRERDKVRRMPMPAVSVFADRRPELSRWLQLYWRIALLCVPLFLGVGCPCVRNHVNASPNLRWWLFSNFG